MATIGRLAKRFNLSRSTLLYYDTQGVLSPSGRTAKGYRDYDEADARRLERICLYRRAGVALKDIRKILDAPEDRLADVLQRRLQKISEEISGLQDQQSLVLAMLQQKPPLPAKGMDRKTWTGLLVASGFSEADMRAWHIAFENRSPKKHQEFLEFLGIKAAEIARIRELSETG